MVQRIEKDNSPTLPVPIKAAISRIKTQLMQTASCKNFDDFTTADTAIVIVNKGDKGNPSSVQEDGQTGF